MLVWPFFACNSYPSDILAAPMFQPGLGHLALVFPENFTSRYFISDNDDLWVLEKSFGGYLGESPRYPPKDFSNISKFAEQCQPLPQTKFLTIGRYLLIFQ
jgi:hypothetical protein